MGAVGGYTWETAGVLSMVGTTAATSINPIPVTDPLDSYPYHQIYFKFTPTYTGELHLDSSLSTYTVGGSTRRAMYLYSGGPDEASATLEDDDYTQFFNSIITFRVREGVEYHLRVGAADDPTGLLTYKLKTTFDKYVFTDWAQDPDFQISSSDSGGLTIGFPDMIFNGAPTSIFSGITGRGFFMDPGTPFAPDLNLEFLVDVLNEAQAEIDVGNSQIGSGPVTPIKWFVNRTGGAFPGDTYYYADKSHDVIYFSAHGRLGWYPDNIPPGTIAVEVEGAPDFGQAAQCQVLSGQLSGMYTTNQSVNSSGANWQTYARMTPPTEDFVSIYDSTPPTIDFDQIGLHGGVEVAVWPSGVLSTGSSYVPWIFPEPIDLTSHMSDQGTVIMVLSTEMLAPPNAPSLFDEATGGFGMWMSAFNDIPNALIYVLRPPRYRFVTAKVALPEPGGWQVGEDLVGS